jgi:hypothetical protein
MAKLRIQAPDGKTLVIDATGYDKSEYDDLASAALEHYSSQAGPKNPIPADVENEPGVNDTTVADVAGAVHNLGTRAKAGYAGLANLVSGNGLNQAASDVENVNEGQSPETTAGKIGSAVGSLVTPEQIALQGGLGAALEASGFGPWVGNVMKSWGEKAALSAIGIVKNIAKGIGIENLDALAQFLLNPIKIGSKTFPPIVQALRTPEAMLKAAQEVQQAAGAALGKISPVVDEAVKANPAAIDLPAILQSLDKMKLAVEDVAPNLGKAVVKQYEAAIDDFYNVVQKETLSDNPQLFTRLRDLKTTIGNLVYKHGNPLESKAALEDAYGALSKGIDAAAQAADKTVGAAFDEANAVYTKITAVVEALEGKVLSGSVKGFFSDIPAMGAGMLAGFLNPVAAIPTAIAAHTARNYGPQAIASGLNAISPYAAPIVNTAVRSLPIVGNAISSALE